MKSSEYKSKKSSLHVWLCHFKFAFFKEREFENLQLLHYDSGSVTHSMKNAKIYFVPTMDYILKKKKFSQYSFQTKAKLRNCCGYAKAANKFMHSITPFSL